MPDETPDHSGSPAVVPDDEAPYSVFTTWQKRAIVLAAAITAFFSPLSAQIYLPALTAIARDLEVSISKVNLSITTYMIVQGLMPMLVGSLSDSGGRRPAFLACYLIYVLACVGIALSPGYDAVLGLRCLQSAGSSATVSLCNAVVADTVTSAERGSYIGFTAVPVILAPALGPVIGGLLSQNLGWRSIFWFLAIFAGAAAVPFALFFPETCRLIVGDGSVLPPPLYRTPWQALRSRPRVLEKSVARGDGKSFRFQFPNILGSLLILLEKETALLLGSASLSYAGFYALAAAMPDQLEKRYGLDETQTGLLYLPMAAGSVVAAAFTGAMMKWNYQRHCSRLGIVFDRRRQTDLADFPIEKARMQVGIPLLGVGGAGLVSWGWTLQADASLAAPAVMSAILGFGMVSFNNTVNALLVDIHPGRAGTATAANNFTRCLVGAGATAAIVPMIDGIGVGWAFTVMGALYVVCIPVLWLMMVRGQKWRAQLRDKAQQGS